MILKIYKINDDYTWTYLATPNDFNSQFTVASIQADLGAPSQLRLSVAPTAGKIYDILAGDINFNLGIEVKDGDVSMAFVNSRQPRVDENNGIVSLAFNGASYLLKSSRIDIKDIKTIRSLDDTIQNVCKAVIARPFSQDVTISLDLGILNNYEIMDEAIKKSGGYTWRDNGLVLVSKDTYMPEILYGNFQQIDKIEQNTIYHNRVDSLPNMNAQVVIDAIQVNYSGEILSHIEPVISSTNSGSTTQSLFRLTKESIGIIKSFGRYNVNYPIVEENGKYYVFNTKYTNPINKYNTVAIQDSATNPEDFAVVSTNTAHLKLYTEAVALHKQNEEKVTYSPSVIYLSLVYPGNKIRVLYKNTILRNEGKKQVMALDDTFTLRNINIDLLKL
jgi:hypothetical protein